jgi:hypothetical protein
LSGAGFARPRWWWWVTVVLGAVGLGSAGFGSVAAGGTVAAPPAHGACAACANGTVTITFDGSGTATAATTDPSGGGTADTDTFSWHTVYDLPLRDLSAAAGRSGWTVLGLQADYPSSTFMGTVGASCTAPPGGRCVEPGGGTTCQGSFTNNNSVPLELLALEPGTGGVYMMAAPAFSAAQTAAGCRPAAISDTCDPLYSGPYPGQGENAPVTAQFSLNVAKANATVPVSENRSWSCASSDGQSADAGKIQWTGTVSTGCPSIDASAVRLRSDAALADPGNAGAACGVSIAVSQRIVDLRRGEVLTARLPAGATATSYKWEIKRTSESSWITLSTTTTPSYRYPTKVAGHFAVRVSATVAGATLVSSSKQFEVRFPSYAEIVGNPAVQGFMKATWKDTLALASPQSRQELGYWIWLDTCNGRYGHTTTIAGPRIGPSSPPNAPGSVELGNRPDDVPFAVLATGCAKYIVASFHTHTPTTYRTGNGLRPIGPSPMDELGDEQEHTPGIVYDYIASPPGGKTIPFRYPLGGQAQPYASGPDRRPTPD